MSRVPKRDIAPFLRTVRNILLGREHNSALRFDSECADRDQPPPNIPDGAAHKLYANYYVNRDPRREVTPPIDVSKSLLASGESGGEPAGARIHGVPTPGKPFPWDQH